MSNPKFTQGGWLWSPDKWNGGFSGLFADSGDAVVVPQHRNDGDGGAAWFEEINPADAALIAAAPDLYLALQLLHDDIADYQRINNLGGYENHCMKLARGALAKARGEGEA